MLCIDLVVGGFRFWIVVFIQCLCVSCVVDLAIPGLSPIINMLNRIDIIQLLVQEDTLVGLRILALHIHCRLILQYQFTVLNVVHISIFIFFLIVTSFLTFIIYPLSTL